MTDCDALKIVEYVSGGITFSCTPTSIGKKTIILKKPSGEIAYQQQLDVFCPHQTIVTQGLCFKPDVTNAWQVKKPSASSGLFIKTTLSPSMIYEKGVMYSFDFGDGVSEGYRFSANAYEESEHQYKEAGTYSVTLRIYGDNYENAFIDKKTIEVDRVGHIVVSNYQPSMFETVKMWIVGVFEDVRKIVWGSGNTVSQPKDTTEAFSNSYELGLQTIKATLFNAQEQKIGQLSTQIEVGCSLGQKYQAGSLKCIDAPLQNVGIYPTAFTELTKTKITVTGLALPSSAILEIDGAVCDEPIEASSTSFSQWCIASNVGQVIAKVKYAKTINNGKVELPLTVDIKAVAYQPINDTGIDQCSDTNTMQDCQSMPSNWLGLNQDAEFGRDALAAKGQLTKVGGGKSGFDFSKISAIGQKLPANANEWSCVLDSRTGLLWENKTDDSGLHDFDNLYSYYNSDFSSNSGVLGYLNDGKNSENFVLAVNQEKLCGYSDWRLPTAGELLGIVDFGKNHTVPIEIDYFPDTQGAWYLTQTISYKNHTPFVINFSNKNASYAANREYFVRLVRGGQ
jgi:hypothetical protein